MKENDAKLRKTFAQINRQHTTMFLIFQPANYHVRVKKGIK